MSKNNGGYKRTFLDECVYFIAEMAVDFVLWLLKVLWEFVRDQIYLLLKIRPKIKLKKIERKDLMVKKRTLKDHHLGYSVTKKKPICTNEIKKNMHSLVIGASGAGKTSLYDTLIFDDLIRKKPVLFIDPKGDRATLERFKKLCALANRKCKVFTDCAPYTEKISLNPLKEGTVNNITDRLHHSFTWSDKHYENLCYRALFDAVEICHKKYDAVSFSSILDTLNELTKESNGNKPKYKLNDILGIIIRIQKIANSDFGSYLSESGNSIKELWESGDAVYIGASVLGHAETARSIAKIFVGDMNYSVYDVYKKLDHAELDKLRPFAVYIDEFSSVVTNEFIELLNKCRGAKLELNMAIQSPSDIRKVNEGLLGQVLENTSNWFILKQRMESEASLLSKSIGTIQTTKVTKKISQGSESRDGSSREVEELIAHSNIIKSLNIGQCVLLQHFPVDVDLVNLKYIDPNVVDHNYSVLNQRRKYDKNYSYIKEEQYNEFFKS